jgi:hypothetical protein
MNRIAQVSILSIFSEIMIEKLIFWDYLRDHEKIITKT